LKKEIKTKRNQALDERQIKEDQEKLRDYYQKAGYNQVSISYTIDLDRVGGFGTVVYKIKEGEKVKIAEITFAGNANIKAAKLKGQMETKKWWMFSWLTGSGRFKDDQFEDDLDKLRDYYREEGLPRRRYPPGKDSVQLPETRPPRHRDHGGRGTPLPHR
jgi:outer membrane protein insertion porin family